MDKLEVVGWITRTAENRTWHFTQSEITARWEAADGNEVRALTPLAPAQEEIERLRAEVERLTQEVSDLALTPAADFPTTEARAEAWSDGVEIQRLVEGITSVFAKWTSPEILSRFRQQVMALAQQGYIEGYAAGFDLVAAEKQELERIFDLQWEADMRAVEAWRAESPGRDLTLPDRSEMTRWLLSRALAAEAQVERMREALHKIAFVKGVSNVGIARKALAALQEPRP